MAELKKAEAAKRPAKMGHNKDTNDTGRKKSIPCSCGGVMEWCKVKSGMRWVCGSCGLICDK